MNKVAVLNGVPQITLEYYEQECADRHLLHGAVEKWARETPDQVAIIDEETGREYTYAEFNEASTTYALKLLEMGFEVGDFLVTSLPLFVEHIFLEYACFKIGVVHTPLDLRLKPEEIVRSIDLVHPRGYVLLGNTPFANFTEMGKVVQQECDYIDYFIQFESPDEVMPGATSFAEWVASAPNSAQAEEENSELWQQYEQRQSELHPNLGAQVIYTTGSTGFPKPALLSHRNITSQNLCLASGFEMTEDSRMLINLPPSHVGCQGEELMTSFFCGSTAIILRMFDAEKTMKAIEDYGVNLFGQIPAMFNMQWRLPNYSDFDISSVEKVLHGGQQVSTQFVNRLLNEYGRVGTGLGLTEMSGFVTYTGVLDDAEYLAESLGWWMPITPLTIREPMNEDGTAGKEVADGEVGEICFTGPQVFIGYVNNEEAYNKTVSKEGVCYTGDLGCKSDRGLLFKGRSKLVIKPKGYQVHPAQVEGHFANLEEQVANCGAVGVAHDVYLEAIILFVEKKKGAELTVEQLKEHAKGIAAYMRPEHYIILEQGEFPLNRVSKSDYVRMKQIAQEEVEQLRLTGQWD